MIEDVVQSLYHKAIDRRHVTQWLQSCCKILGYAWVILFTIWTSPVWIYPALANMRKADALLSLDAVRPVLFGRDRA